MEKITKKHIAPCGMNCGVCLGYLRAKNKCSGCFSGRKISGRPIKCGRKLCKERKGDFCCDCDKFPCDSIKRLDKRYRERYDFSEIENLKFIKAHGIEKFVENQNKKYISPKGVYCVHDKKYYK